MDLPSRPDRRPAAAALLAGLLALPYAFAGREFYDELTYLGHGLRILDGQVIYRDFFEFLAPLTSYLAAWLFAATGPSILSARLLVTLLVAIAAGLLARLAARLEVTGAGVLLPGLLVAAVGYSAVPGYSHHWIVLVPTLGALLAAMSGADDDAPPWTPWLAAGACAGVACLTMQSDGLALAGALGGWLVLEGLFGPTPATTLARRAAGLAAGALAVVAPAFGYLAWQQALGAAYTDTWWWTHAHYRIPGGLNDVYYMVDLPTLVPTLDPHFRLWRWYVNAGVVLGVLWLPVALAGLSAVRLAMLVRARRQGERWTPATARLALVALASLAVLAVLVRGRADFAHDLYYMPLPWLYATALAWRLGRRLQAEPPLPWLGAAALVGFGLAGLLLAGAAMADDPALRPRAGGIDAAFRRDPVVRYLHEHARPGDRMAAFPYGGEFYLYGGVRPATRFTFMLLPGEGYYDQADYDTFWGQVRTTHPRFLLITPVHPQDVAGKPPVDGYALATVIHGEWAGGRRRTYVYEAAATP